MLEDFVLSLGVGIRPILILSDHCDTTLDPSFNKAFWICDKRTSLNPPSLHRGTQARMLDDEDKSENGLIF